MSALFRRHVYKPVGLIRHRFMTERYCDSVRTLKTVFTDSHVTPPRPLSAVRATCPVYCKARRHLSDDVRSHKDRIESAADGRWSNRCNCCGLNSKGA